MPQRSKGARLYFDRTRQRWAIRDGIIFIRTRYREHQTELATAALWRYIKDTASRRLGRIIYFVTCEQDDFPIKIGMSVDVTGRLRDLATALPYPIKLLGMTEGTSRNESEIHRRFDAIRLKGEWFTRTPDLLEFIKAAATISVPFPCRTEKGEAA